MITEIFLRKYFLHFCGSLLLYAFSQTVWIFSQSQARVSFDGSWNQFQNGGLFIQKESVLVCNQILMCRGKQVSVAHCPNPRTVKLIWTCVTGCNSFSFWLLHLSDLYELMWHLPINAIGNETTGESLCLSERCRTLFCLLFFLFCRDYCISHCHLTKKLMMYCNTC